MQEVEKEFYRKKAQGIVDTLKKKRYEACFFETASEASQYILDYIQAGESVGLGGSLTLRQDLGLKAKLRDKGHTVYDHWEAGDAQERLELKRAHRGVDVFLSSFNAITTDGLIVNLDGGGNRVASTLSGPKKVILVGGINKITDTLDQALHQTKHVSAVLNAMRLKTKTPCAETGQCSDCNTPGRICNALLILYRKPMDIEQYTVILVNETLGM